MTLINAKIDVHSADDVTLIVETNEFLDAIGPVDDKIERALDEALEAYVDEHAYYHSERWYSLIHERDSQEVLRGGLATALDIDSDDISADYSFCTCNWQNNLSEDFGGTLWTVADGHRYLTIESGEHGYMNSAVGVRSVEYDEPEYLIVHSTSEVMIGCTECDFGLDTAHDRIEWADLTRQDDDEYALDDLFCPRCGHTMVAQVCA
jgi:hypothetical protein